MTFKIIETFSGIGSQAKAFSKIKQKNPEFNYKVVATVEWEIGASYAYDIIHNGPQKLEKYDDYTKEDLVESLGKLNLSSDGKLPLKDGSLNRMSIQQLKAIKHSLDENNNFVDISSVKASELPDAELLTYSFPCQDLSISSYWHGNFSGIDKDAGNRSGLLWQIERLLKEYQEIGKKMPRFLLMENVSAIHGPLHEKNFKMWRKELESMGYLNHYYDLDASDFGVPQSRVRTFMISVYSKDLLHAQRNAILNFFQTSDLNRASTANPTLDMFLKLNYFDDEQYLKEAMESTPNFTESRKRIYQDSVKLAYGNDLTGAIAKTITTKQDRNPNAGIIVHQLELDSVKAPYRNLTPRETFLLMGFEEDDFQRLVDNNLNISKVRKFLSHSKLLKLSGNSIVVNVLEEIFSELLYLNASVINPPSNLTFLEESFG